MESNPEALQIARMYEMSDGSIGGDGGSQVPSAPATSGDASHGSYRFVDFGPSLRRKSKREAVPDAVQVKLSKKAHLQLKELEAKESADGEAATELR